MIKDNETEFNNIMIEDIDNTLLVRICTSDFECRNFPILVEEREDFGDMETAV